MCTSVQEHTVFLYFSSIPSSFNLSYSLPVPQLSISQRSPETQDDMFLGFNCFISSDSQSYHEGLSDIPLKKDVPVASQRRISEPQPPVFEKLEVHNENLWSVNEDEDDIVTLRKSHLVSHTQSLEELRPRPLSHVLSLPTNQHEEEVLAKSMVPNLRWVWLYCMTLQKQKLKSRHCLGQ